MGRISIRKEIYNEQERKILAALTFTVVIFLWRLVVDGSEPKYEAKTAVGSITYFIAYFGSSAIAYYIILEIILIIMSFFKNIIKAIN